MATRMLVIEAPDKGSYGEVFSVTVEDGDLSLNRWESVPEYGRELVRVREATPADVTAAFIEAKEADGSAERLRAILRFSPLSEQRLLIDTMDQLGTSALLTPLEKSEEGDS